MAQPSNTCTRCGVTDLVVVLVVAGRHKGKQIVDRLCPACWRAGRDDGSIDGGGR